VAHPELIVSDIKYGIESAYFFWDSRHINPIADSDDVVKVTIAVNGETNGIDDRKMRLKKIKALMGI
jgi:predicted chitinase